MNELVTTTEQMKVRDAVGPTNINSIRYKNLAAIMPNTRYEQLLGDHPNDPGRMLIGPSGEVAYTGDLRRDQMEHELPKVDVVHRISQLVVSQLELPIPANPDDTKIPWQVRVTSDLHPDKPGPAAHDLLEATLARLLDQHPEASHIEL